MMTDTSTTPAEAGEIVRDPRWFPIDLDPMSTTLRFVHTDRATLAGQGALGGEHWDTAGLPERAQSVAALAHAFGAPQKPRLNFIWHTAYCCSTLLSQLIDQPGVNLSLREPRVLIVLSNAKRSGHFALGGRERLPETVFRLLARAFPPDRSVTIKPAPAANYLIRDAAALTEGRMLFLYCDCASFLASVAKEGEARRGFMRQTFSLILGDGNEQQNWRKDRLFELSDLQIAALVWHMQIAEFRRSWPAIGSGRAASLDCDAFLDAPEETLAKLDEFFGLGLGTARVRENLAGPLMTRHAKRPGEPFGIAQRRSEREKIDPLLKRDIDAIVDWSYEACRTTPRGGPLPDPLVATDKARRT